MNKYNRMLQSKFNGCPLLGVQRDEARNRDMHLYYIGEETLVGVYDGVDTWISPIYKCFMSFKDDFLAEQIKLASEGKIAAEQKRHKLIIPLTRKTLLKRNTVHAN